MQDTSDEFVVFGAYYSTICGAYCKIIGTWFASPGAVPCTETLACTSYIRIFVDEYFESVPLLRPVGLGLSGRVNRVTRNFNVTFLHVHFFCYQRLQNKSLTLHRQRIYHIFSAKNFEEALGANFKYLIVINCFLSGFILLQTTISFLKN